MGVVKGRRDVFKRMLNNKQKIQGTWECCARGHGKCKRVSGQIRDAVTAAMAMWD